MDALLGLRTTDWLRLLKENRFDVDRVYWKRVVFVTFMSLLTSIGRKRENRIFATLYENKEIKPPLFILGHWRSGTTLLHELIIRDEQFEYSNAFQVSHPHTFLIREGAVEKTIGNAKAQKRHMDNVQVAYNSPAEDESALCVATLRSPLIAWSFPRRESYYDRFLTFDDVAENDIQQWKEAFIVFLKKLTWRYNKTLVLKSPTHTARIRLLLEMFPNARFVHIHRNPYRVFQSTLGLYEQAVPNARLQQPNNKPLKSGILKRYQMMYDSFFEQKKLIPKGRYCEIRFEELVKDKVGQVKKIYDKLEIPGFQDFEPKLKQYVESISKYKKNIYKPMHQELKQEVFQAWQRNFREWNYDI